MSSSSALRGGPRDVVRRLREHIRRLWPRYAYLPVLPFLLYAVVSAARSDLRIEHVLIVLLVAGLAYVGPRSKELLLEIYPFGLVGLLFDGMRPFQWLGLTPERVHVCDVRAIESQFFGFESGGVRYTLHDWFLVHHTPLLDLVAAVPYATFVFVSLGCGIFLWFRDRTAMRRFTWGWFLLNVAGFATYHLVPAAPPWYFHEHGCAVDLATRASEGPALMRVDAMLGVGYFHAMYSKASSVFGAIPSLHCAYPLLVVIEGWRSFGPKLRASAIAYWLTMIFSAVYLDHHWVLDAIIGSLYAIAAVLVLRRLVPDAARADTRHAAIALHRPRGRTFARALATWFGCGLSPIAPGTVGSLGALPLYFAVRGGGPVALLGVAALVTVLGVWAAGIVARESGVADPQSIVIDEAAGTLLVLAVTPPSVAAIIVAVALFRVFDIVKPFPARRAERLPGGWGIVLDDVVAGAQAAVVIGALRAARVLG